jgi:hypothetical protein
MIATKDATAATAGLYKGWSRPARGRRWRCLVEDAATYDEAWCRHLGK